MNYVGVGFHIFEIWMKELSILDLRFGFYVKNQPYGPVPRSKIVHPEQNTRKCMFTLVVFEFG